VLITLKSSELSKEVRPGSIEAICYASLCCCRKVKRSTLSFSRFAPHHGRLFRPLSPIVISVTTVRRHDVALPSISATVFTTPRSRELTLLSPVLSTPDTRLGQLTVATRSEYKMEPFTRNRRYESSISIKLGIITVVVLLLASLATCH
jgi:hypothetical protein